MPDPAPSVAAIRIHGARTHNLRNVSVELPRNKLVVITGVSGSGKSSLAFDTLLAEGQRQYIDSLSIYSRQFFDQMPRPDVDRIEGLQPAIAIDQSQGSHNPRSTVGTVTEIHDYLRLLYARCGSMACAECGLPITQQSPQEIEDAIRTLPPATRVMILAPLVQGRKGQHADVLETARKAGFVRVRVDGQTYAIEESPELDPAKNHDVEAVVDRVVLREGLDTRLSESVRLALKHGDDVLRIVYQTAEEKTNGNASLNGRAGEEAWRERLFNTRYACPVCKSGVAEVEPRTFSFNSPYGACPVCEGLGKLAPPDDPTNESPCPACHGARLRPEARACKVGGLAIHELSARTICDASTTFAELTFGPDKEPIATPILREIRRRLAFLNDSGVGYLSLDRPANTLSGGELQRVRLATGIGSGLVGVMYLLDEPSIGLHPRDNDRLLTAMRSLQQQGNTVLVVEHDEAVIRAADWVIDVGPGAGVHGGEIVAVGPPAEIAECKASITGGYLSGRRSITAPEKRRRIAKTRMLTLEGATLHNLRGDVLEVPLGAFTCVTGVSGSGKSSLIMETLCPALARRVNGGEAKLPAGVNLRGASQLDRVVEVDQSPIGRSPRSNALTFTGAFDEIRKVFARTKLARQRGYSAGRFSFNTKGGRCEECQGQGVKRLAMNFLPDLFVACPQCRGARFNRPTLAIKFRGKSIADVLALTVDQALEFFESFESLLQMLRAMSEVGLGYLSLGQPANTLSGGEAQRIKLAAELGAPKNGHALFILDEPTTGLSLDDVRKLLAVLQQLVDAGNSVLVIEHHLDVMKCADWVIDLGPDGGAGGGQIVAAGTPEEVAACDASYTGRWLKGVL